jgi:hypothetical protein
MSIVVGCTPVVSTEPSPSLSTAPVYEVVSEGLSEEQARKLQEVFQLKDLALDEFGVAHFVDEDAFLALPMTQLEATDVQSEDKGPVVFEGFDFEAIKQIKVMDTEEAIRLTSDALKNAGLQPQEGSPLASHSMFEALTVGGEQLASQPIDTSVSYVFTLGGVPLEGPGAKVRVAFAGDGHVVQLSYAVRQLRQSGEVEIADTAEALARCATWTTSGENNTLQIKEATLAYFAPPLSSKTAQIEPSFRCTGVDKNGASAQVFFVPAAQGATPPSIEIPEQENRPLSFNNHMAARLALGNRFSTGRVDVGSEGTGPCSGLPNTGTNVAGFNNRMTSAGIPVQFTWLNGNAWEDDWKDPSHSGNDSSWVDDVDMAYWQGHGWPGGFSFSGCSSIDDDSMTNADALWGNRDSEWISLFTCLVLAIDDGGMSWADRWGSAFDGLHQINGFVTVSYHSSQHGGIYADYLVRTPFLWWNNPMKVRDAWAQASIDDQPAEVIWATMGVISSGGLVNYNDYFWGSGSVGPDIPASQISGYWHISGNS